MAREIYTLDEGECQIEFPSKLSKQSVDNLEEYINLMLKRMRQRVRETPHDQPTS